MATQTKKKSKKGSPVEDQDLELAKKYVTEVVQRLVMGIDAIESTLQVVLPKIDTTVHYNASEYKITVIKKDLFDGGNNGQLN